MHGVKRVIVFCILIVILPATLIIIPLYLRHSVFADVVYPVAESDIIEIRDGISSIFCQQHTLHMSSNFNAFQLSSKPEISTNRKHIRLKKSMVLPDDTLEYWGFYLLKGAKVELKFCSRYDGSRILVVKGERNLQTCGLLEHNKNKVGTNFAEGHEKVKVYFEDKEEFNMISKETNKNKTVENENSLNKNIDKFEIKRIEKKLHKEILNDDELENNAGEDFTDNNSGNEQRIESNIMPKIKRKNSNNNKTDEIIDNMNLINKKNDLMSNDTLQQINSKKLNESELNDSEINVTRSSKHKINLPELEPKRFQSSKSLFSSFESKITESNQGSPEKKRGRTHPLKHYTSHLEFPPKKSSERRSIKDNISEPIKDISTNTESQPNRQRRHRRHHHKTLNNPTTKKYESEEEYFKRLEEHEIKKQKIYNELYNKNLRRSKREHVYDRKISHGGNALNFTEKEESNSISSFENSLLTCYDGKILVAEGFPPSQMCTNVHYLATMNNVSHMITSHEVTEDGYYYYIFYSDNDLVRNDIHAIFDIFKPTFQYSNITADLNTQNCINSTNCTFQISFYSNEYVVVEVPTRDGIEHDEDDITYLYSTCHPRSSVYIIFPIAVLVLILSCAFL